MGLIIFLFIVIEMLVWLGCVMTMAHINGTELELIDGDDLYELKLNASKVGRVFLMIIFHHVVVTEFISDLFFKVFANETVRVGRDLMRQKRRERIDKNN